MKPAEALDLSSAEPYGFSTPEMAVKSMIEAAQKGDEQAFKRGMSGKLLEQTLAETTDLSEPMRDLSNLSYLGQRSKKGNAATVNMTNSTTKEILILPMIRENGEWKLDLPTDHE
jgi:signal transduction histidine kinase